MTQDGTSGEALPEDQDPLDALRPEPEPGNEAENEAGGFLEGREGHASEKVAAPLSEETGPELATGVTTLGENTAVGPVASKQAPLETGK